MKHLSANVRSKNSGQTKLNVYSIQETKGLTAIKGNKDTEGEPAK